MNIGFGIFGGLVVLGIIYLYTQTKDRWNWSKIAKRSLIALGVIVAIPIAGIVISIGYGKIAGYIESQPKALSNYGGLTLGEKVTDVEFRSKLEDMTKPDDKDHKRFAVTGTNLLFDTKDNSGKVDKIIINCQDGDTDTVNGVSCYDNSEKIFDQYGKNNISIYCKVKRRPSDTVDDLKQIRLYESEKYGVTYGMHLNKVRAIFIQAPTKPRDTEYWDLCDKQK